MWNDLVTEEEINPLMHDVPKWSNSHQKSSSICYKIFKACLTIFGALCIKGLKCVILIFPEENITISKAG